MFSQPAFFAFQHFSFSVSWSAFADTGQPGFAASDAGFLHGSFCRSRLHATDIATRVILPAAVSVFGFHSQITAALATPRMKAWHFMSLREGHRRPDEAAG